MLVISNITKRFPGAETPILRDISLAVNAGERVGLIGPNGCGKSTLLGIIMGTIPADSGGIIHTVPAVRIGYLSQGLDVPDDTPIRDVLFPQASALRQAEAEVEQLAEALANSATAASEPVRRTSDLAEAYNDALERLEHLSRAVDSGQGETILAELGLADLPPDTVVGTLSGGQKTRLGLASMLVNRPNLLILDEPTNHLDITALEWLEHWLQGYQGGAVIVSHDRTFLDNTVNRIVAIDPHTHTARVYEGSYSDYARTVRSELDKRWAEWRDQRVEITRLEHDVQQTMAKAIRRENATNNDQQRRYAKKVAKRAKAKEKRLERYLDSDERVEKPPQSWSLKLDFGDLPTTGQDVIFLENLSIGYRHEKPLLSGLNLALRAGERVAVLGPNGIGKSTLLKTILGEVPPLAGRVRIGASVRIGYLAQEQEILDLERNALDTLLDIVPTFGHTEARSFLHFFLFTGDDVFRPTGQLSFGERVRLMLAMLVARGANLLILDEPINHLDIPSRERFEHALQAFQGSVLAVVHDRYFVDQFATAIWELSQETLRVR